MFEQPLEPTRRWFLSRGFMTGITGGVAVYIVEPEFWHQYADELFRAIVPAPNRPRVEAWSDSGLHAAWIGHSTVLLQIDGFRILTDPVFSDYAGLQIGPLPLGLKRIVRPALSIAEIGRIDLILLSHAHMDHLDVGSMRRLEAPRVEVVTASGTSDLLRAGRYARISELRWGECRQAGPARISAFRVKHGGARFRRDRSRRSNGYFIEAGRYSVLFAGDTALTDAFRQWKRPRPIDLAIMPVGAYNPWITGHCTPEEAWRMANEAAAEFFLPVHHQTFRLGREPLMEPIARALEAAGSEGRRVPIRGIGQEFAI